MNPFLTCSSYQPREVLTGATLRLRPQPPFVPNDVATGQNFPGLVLQPRPARPDLTPAPVALRVGTAPRRERHFPKISTCAGACSLCPDDAPGPVALARQSLRPGRASR